jgi:hypothetical protein
MALLLSSKSFLPPTRASGWSDKIIAQFQRHETRALPFAQEITLHFWIPMISARRAGYRDKSQSFRHGPILRLSWDAGCISSMSTGQVYLNHLPSLIQLSIYALPPACSGVHS